MYPLPMPYPLSPRRIGFALTLVVGLLANPVVWSASEPWTLERAIRTALTNSPDARLAQHRIAAAAAGLQQANAPFWPQLQFNTSYRVTDNPMQAFGMALNQQSANLGLLNNVPDTDDLNLNGLLVVPLYRGGQNTAGRREATARLAASQNANAAAQQSLAYEVARGFYTVRKAHSFIQATEAAVAAYEANLATSRQRQLHGTALKTDVLDVEVRLAEARENLVRARNAHSLALQAVRNLLAVDDPDFSLALAAPDLSLPAVDQPMIRPELLAARKEREAAEAALQRARGGYRPTVNAFGRYDYDRGWQLDGEGNSYTAGVELQWNLWDGNLTRGRVREAQAHLDSAQELERKIQLAIDLQVTEARLRLREAEERLQVSAQATAQAAESAQLTRARFEQGLALSTQLIDSQTALTAAQVRRAEAEADRQIAVAALRRALGLPQLDPLSDTR